MAKENCHFLSISSSQEVAINQQDTPHIQAATIYFQELCTICRNTNHKDFSFHSR